MSFTQTNYEVDESDGIVTVCVILIDAGMPIGDAIWLNFTTYNDTASGTIARTSQP